MVKGQTVPCDGALVPVETLRNAILCSKRSIPLLKNDLLLCEKNAKLALDAFKLKTSNMESAIGNGYTQTKWNSLISSFAVGALIGVLTVSLSK